MGRESRTRLVTVAVLVAVFAAGVLVGVAADASGTAQAAEVAVQPVAPDTTEAEDQPRPRARWEMVEPAPNESQLAVIDSIVKVHRARTNALSEEHRVQTDALGEQTNRRFREIVLETREAIKGVFTEVQAAEYQRLLDEWDARRAERDNEDERD